MTQPSPAWLNAAAVEDRMKRVDAVAAMRNLFQAHGQGRVTLSRRRFSPCCPTAGATSLPTGILPEDVSSGSRSPPGFARPVWRQGHGHDDADEP